MDNTEDKSTDQKTFQTRTVEHVPLKESSQRVLMAPPVQRLDSAKGSMRSNSFKHPQLTRRSSKGSDRERSKTSLFRTPSQLAADSKSRSFRYKKRFANTIFYSSEEREAALRKARLSPNPVAIILQGIILVATKMELEEKELKKMKYQELFSAIDKDKSGTINVSTELGETLIRLGLGIDASIMRDAINHVCNRRGRKPDGWYGMNLSTPIYNEIDLDEFQEVMYTLANDDLSDLDHINKAWRVFSAIDQDKDNILSPQELWQVCSDFHARFTLEDCAQAVLNQFGEGGMTFEAFLRFTGCEGNVDDVLQAHLVRIHHDLEECLTTFRTFDLDGSGTIDFSETAQVMRAMGHRVTQPQLDEIFSLCDPQGLGEIDFESFCTHVLGFEMDRALRLMRTHVDRSPVYFDPPPGAGPDARPVSLDMLLPELYARVILEREAAGGDKPPPPADGAAAPPASSPTAASRRETLFVWQDFGQYPRAQLGTDGGLSKAELLRVLSRPFAITAHKGHAGVLAARLSPDGALVAVGCEGGVLLLYDVTRPRPREAKRISAHLHHVLCLDWSPDGRYVVTGGADAVVSVWAEALGWTNSACFRLHTGYVRGVSWSPDGALVASCGSDGGVLLWHAAGGELRPTGRPLTGHTSWVRWCRFTEDGKRLVSSGDDHTVIVWDVTGGQPLQTLRGHAHAVAAGALVPGSDKLFTGGFDGEVLVWTRDTGLLGYLKAFNLRRGDTLTGSMSNSRFVSVELGKGQRERTALRKGASPAWHEEFDFSVWDLDEQVFVQVFDWDKDEAHRFLGSLKVSLEELVCAEEGVTDKEFDLVDDEGDRGIATISLRFTYRSVASIGEATVLVERARNLPRMDTFGLSDPFCMVSLGKSEKQKTRVVKRNLNPEWNEEFIYNVEEGARELKLVIYDWNLTQEFDLIGQVIIPVENLISNPFIDEWYPLKSIDGASIAKGELKVQIKFSAANERSEFATRFRRTPTTWPAFVKSDFNFYSPVGQVAIFGRILLRGKCGFCGQHRRDHENDLRCNMGTGNYVHSIDVSYDGTLVAWGTGDGRIRVATVSTAERVGCWTAHAGPVLGLNFSRWDMRLLSWGVDHRHAKPSDLVRGAYAPKKAIRRNGQDSINIVVETWYVGSLMEDRDRWIRKRNTASRNGSLEKSEPLLGAEAGAAPGLSGDETASPGTLPGTPRSGFSSSAASPEASISGSMEDRDDDDESVEDDAISMESDEENGGQADNKRKDDKEGDSKAKQARYRIKLQLRKGARKIEGRVGYTPVYYDPPVKADGTLAKSCLKGRSGKRPLRTGLVFNDVKPKIFNYPPEDPGTSDENVD